MTKSSKKTERELHSIRDTVESVWVAIVLAFVLRAFLIEAFVIPTGSMAPRLMGEHWQLTCQACGYDYAYGLSTAAQNDSRLNRNARLSPTGATCPNCRYPFYYGPDKEYPRNGDRVLVLKYLYDFRQPEPWEVVVFRNPQDNRQNYIKRLIGTPGEMLEIVHGDIFYREGTDRNGDGHIDEKDYEGPESLIDSPWRIRRKPDQVQQALWQVVYDNDYLPSRKMLKGKGVYVPHWTGDEDGWAGLDTRRFAYDGNRPAGIRFQGGWDAYITRYGYNPPTYHIARSREALDLMEIVSDLKLSFVFTPTEANSKIAASLTSLDHRFRAELSADGEAVLLYDAPDGTADNWAELARTNVGPLRPGKSYAVAFEHADYRVKFWVDGKAVLASNDQNYPANIDVIKTWLVETLSRWGESMRGRPVTRPEVGIAASGGACEVTHVRLERDVYYTNQRLAGLPYGAKAPSLGNYASLLGVRVGQDGWASQGNPITLRKFPDSQLDEFFMLGDNSPHSLDGRAWTAAAPTLRLTDDANEPLYRLGTVPRYSLIGKAFFVYWPSGFRVPGLPGLPVVPNVGRMRFIR